MPFQLDPDLLHAVAGAPPRATTRAARDDHQLLRSMGEAGLAAIEAALPEHADVERVDHFATSHDGAQILVRWYRLAESARTSEPGPAVVYLHGGGMILGSVELYDRFAAGYVANAGIPMLAVDYRLAPEHPHPSPLEDSFAGLSWLVDYADDMGVDRRRVAIMGDSAGGGLAAGVALMARDRQVALARQILIYPMLDDRTTNPDPSLAPFAVWSYDDNYTGWHALLGDAIGTADVPAYAAPARAADLSGLPPAYVETGELDIFRDESIEYARRIAVTGTSIELHVHPGCPHGFDRIGSVAVVQRALADRCRVLRGL